MAPTNRPSGMVAALPRLRPMAALSIFLVLLGSLVLIPASKAHAVSCTGQVRYASSTNTTYLTSGNINLPDLLTICPSTPLVQTSSGVWELQSNLMIQNGATLNITGTAAGGTVNTLRLDSSSDNSPLDVVSITAQYGTLNFNHVNVTSWDPNTNGPDTNPNLPDGADPDTSRARSFIRALSYMDGSTPLESTMNIANSDMGYLGWYDAESYGVAFKGRGCDSTHLDVCAALNVYGSETNSRFHNNWMGTYTFDAYQMLFDHNEYDHNVMYGLDPHDDSDYLTITYNKFHDNGDHGLICSQRCDHLEIANNESYHNGIPPFAFPGDDDLSDNQIHGIMIHRGVTDSIIENNYIHDQPNGAGIAVFDSSNDIIRNNIIDGAKYGIRLSVGTENVTFANNTVSNSSQYGIYSYQGSDIPAYTVPSGRPTADVFTGNILNGSGSNLVKLNNSDAFTFTNTSVSGTVGTVYSDSSSMTWDSDAVPGAGLVLKNTSSSPAATVRLPLAAFSVNNGSAGTTTITAPDSRLSEVTNGAPDIVASPTGTSYVLSSATTGTSALTVTPRPVTVIPSTGTALAAVSGFTSSTKHVTIKSATTGSSVTFKYGGLTAGTNYVIRVDGTTLTSKVADSTGAVSWTYSVPNTASHDFTLKTS
jgi:poly(beta-D-mannuronate) C5 epimerase